jgi:hypothetical protein
LKRKRIALTMKKHDTQAPGERASFAGARDAGPRNPGRPGGAPSRTPPRPSPQPPPSSGTMAAAFAKLRGN